MIIDHIGIVVKSLKAGINHWEKLFNYTPLTEPVVNTRQNVKVVFLHKKDSTTIKLMEPTDDTSPIFTYAKRGGGLHHLCFRCDNLDKEVSHLRDTGLRVLVEPQPGEAFENENIAFIFAKQGLNIELIDTTKKANLL